MKREHTVLLPDIDEQPPVLLLRICVVHDAAFPAIQSRDECFDALLLCLQSVLSLHNKIILTLLILVYDDR